MGEDVVVGGAVVSVVGGAVEVVVFSVVGRAAAEAEILPAVDATNPVVEELVGSEVEHCLDERFELDVHSIRIIMREWYDSVTLYFTGKHPT